MNATNAPTARPVTGLEKILALASVLLALSFLFIDAYIIFSRIGYRYELDGIEGEGLVQVNRILAGLPLYARPTVEYVALIYPPLYYYAAALVSRLTVPGFLAMRSISLLSTLVCAGLLFTMVREATKKTLPALLAVGCFAASFLLTDQWFDIARTDMLATALCFLAIFLVREASNTRPFWADIASGMVFSLAFLTKQQELIVFLVLLAYYALIHWRTALRMALSFLLFTAILFAFFQKNTAGWFFYYFFTIPSAHKFALSVPGIIHALFSQFRPIPFFLLVGFVPVMFRPLHVLKDRSFRFSYVAALAMIAAGTVGLLNKFAGRNVMVITYLGVALLLGLAINWLFQQSHRANLAQLWSVPFAAGCVLLIAQFGLLYPGYFSTRLIPTHADQLMGDNLVAQIKDAPGNILAIDENYLLLYAGKPIFFSEMAMTEVAGEGSRYSMPEWNDLHSQIYALFHASSTSALYVDYYARYQKDIAACSISKIRYPDKLTFLPVTGFETRPNFTISCN